jgi:hypothetical protein
VARAAGPLVAVLESRLRLYKMLGCAKLTLDPSRVALLTISLLHHLVQENCEVGLRLAERPAWRAS